MSLSKLRELVMDREAWHAMGLQRIRHDWVTELNWTEPFHTAPGVLMEIILEGLPFPPPMYYILSELVTMIHLSWVVLHSMAHSLIEFCKPLHHNMIGIHEGLQT